MSACTVPRTVDRPTPDLAQLVLGRIRWFFGLELLELLVDRRVEDIARIIGPVR